MKKIYQAYSLQKEICAKSAVTDEYYPYFDDFVSLLDAKSSYVRTRGFLLCCTQARWDTYGKIQSALTDLLKLLHDEKPTVVRQCLGALHEVALFRPELCEAIKEEVERIDLSKYTESDEKITGLHIRPLLSVFKKDSTFIVIRKIITTF